MAYPTRSILLLGLLVVAAPGCDSADSADSMTGADDASSSDPTETGETDGPSQTGGEDPTDASSDSGDPELPAVSLFECGLPLACEPLFDHISLEPQSAIDCVVELTATGGPGVFTRLESVGSDVLEQEDINILRADGTVVRQSRNRQCEDCDEATLPWELGAPEVCELAIDQAAYEQCRSGDVECPQTWSFENCTAAPDVDCAELESALEETPPPPIECGDDACALGGLCVQQPPACACDPATGEFDYVAVAPTCEQPPPGCEGLKSDALVACYGALCEGGPSEFDDLGPAGTLECGEVPSDCFGPC